MRRLTKKSSIKKAGKLVAKHSAILKKVTQKRKYQIHTSRTTKLKQVYITQPFLAPFVNTI